MTTPIEAVFRFLAPHDCISCGSEGRIICELCGPDLIDENFCCCHVCGLPATDYQPCDKCLRKTALDGLFVVGGHENELRQIIQQLKFDGSRQAARDVAPVMASLLPMFEKNTLITHLPTAYTRARSRGFDHAELMAKELGANLNLNHTSLLRRRDNSRQVGADKATRLKQAEDMFSLRKPEFIKNQTIILVDDVATTGASMEAAAKIMQDGGAEEVFGVVLARNK